MNIKIFSLILILLYQNFLTAFSFGGLWQKTETETITKEYPVSERCCITIHNKEGSICVKSWPQKKILIEAIKTGVAEDQKNTIISAKASGREASIITRDTPNQKYSKVEYNLMVPEDSTITITQTNGPVKIRGINGSIDITLVEKGSLDIIDSTGTVRATTAQGDILVQQKKFDESASIILKSERGNIALLTPRETRALLHAKTAAGKITCEHPVTASFTSKLNDAAWEHIKKDIECTLGGIEGGAPITLETAKGSITIKEY